MKATGALLTMIAVVLLAAASPAFAGDEGTTTGTTSTQSIILAGQQANEAQAGGVDQSSTSNATETVGSTEPALTWTQQPVCETVGASGCLQSYLCPDGTPAVTWEGRDDDGVVRGLYTQCPQDPPPTAATTPTATIDIPAEVLKAFEKVELPESTINVQPPGGETLVNLPTILSTSAERHQIPVHLNRVNIDVLLEVWPSNFVWHHGDDTSQTTSTPGKAWTEGADMAGLITHTYAKTSKGLQLSVDTTWSAQFKVVGQPDWRPVDGTVAITGTPVDVAVLEAKPQLVR